MNVMASAWKSAPIAAPWRQCLCGSIGLLAVLTVLFIAMSRPSRLVEPDAKPESPRVNEIARATLSPGKAPQSEVRSVSLVMPAFTVARPQVTPAPQATSETSISPMSLRMADGSDFPLVITIPAGPAWRDAFRLYGGAIGVTNSSSSRPAYLSHTISPDGRREEDGIPTIGRFLFRLSEEAIQMVNATLEPAAQIAPGQSAFGVFAAPFRRVVARVLQEFCTAEHVNPDDLAAVQLELGPGFGLRVASTTRRPKKS